MCVQQDQHQPEEVVMMEVTVVLAVISIHYNEAKSVMMMWCCMWSVCVCSKINTNLKKPVKIYPLPHMYVVKDLVPVSIWVLLFWGLFLSLCRSLSDSRGAISLKT